MSGRNLEEALDTIVPTGAITGERMQAELARVLEPGDTIGRYVVLGRVGAGGMGIVYSAYDPDLDRKIALKLLRDATPPGSERKAETRLLNEAQAMARLNHPNVVTVHDVGTFEGQVFIAMEHVDGIP